MTPKLRLSEHARKTLLSSMRKFFWPGIILTKTSTQMIDAPKTQAIPLMIHMIHPRVSLSSSIVTTVMATTRPQWFVALVVAGAAQSCDVVAGSYATGSDGRLG